MRLKEVVQWRLQQLDDSESLQSEEQLIHEAEITRLVIHRLVEIDNVLIDVTQAAFGDDQDAEEGSGEC